MTPLFIYHKNKIYLVRDLGTTQDVPANFKLVLSIDPRVWLQCFLNSEAKDRRRMLKDLEGE